MRLQIRTDPAQPRSKRVRWSQDDLLYELQVTLQSLADVEFRYEVARERLQADVGMEAAKHERLAALATTYQKERHAYVQRLEQLQGEIRSVLFPGL